MRVKFFCDYFLLLVDNFSCIVIMHNEMQYTVTNVIDIVRGDTKKCFRKKYSSVRKGVHNYGSQKESSSQAGKAQGSSKETRET